MKLMIGIPKENWIHIEYHPFVVLCKISTAARKLGPLHVAHSDVKCFVALAKIPYT